MKRTEWIRCPVCGGKTRDRIREDTVLKNHPLYCPKYRQEALIDVVTVSLRFFLLSFFIGMCRRAVSAAVCRSPHSGIT
jgi:hypothetical protein